MEFPRPAELEGELLADEMRAAGLPVDEVRLHGDTLHVTGVADRDAALRVIDAHAPPDPPPDPDVALADAIEAANNVAELKAALLGDNGFGRAAARRP